MKAIVVEIKGRDAIVLDKKGQFLKIKNKQHYKVGYEIDVQSSSLHQYYKWMKPASIAAALIMVIGLSFGVYSYATPYSYIDIDINPSVEITTNRYDKVLKVEALNEDANKLIKGLSWKNKEVEKVVDLLIKDAIAQGYLKQDQDNTVVLSLVSDDDKRSEILEKKISQSAKHQLEDSNVTSEVYVHKANLKTRKVARSLGMTTGKHKLVQKLEDIDPQIDVKAVEQLTVKKIVEAIKEKRKISQEKNKDKVIGDEDFVNKVYQEELDNNEGDKSDSINSNPNNKDNKKNSKIQSKTIIKEITDKDYRPNGKAKKEENKKQEYKKEEDKDSSNSEVVEKDKNNKHKYPNKKDENKGKNNLKKNNSVKESTANLHKNSNSTDKSKEQVEQTTKGKAKQ